MKTVSPSEELNAVDYEVGDAYRLRTTDFFGSSVEYTDGPQANLCEFWRIDPSRPAEELVPPHFHHVRQFLIFTDTGRPTLEEHDDVPQFSFQFTDPSTPYGPVMVDGEYMAFFAMRSKSDIAGHLTETSKEKMRAEPGRKIVVRVQEPASPGTVETLLDGHEDGLAAFRILLDAGEEAVGPDPSRGDGQYYVVMRGSIVHDGRELPPLSLGWVGSGDAAPTITAGTEGAAVLIVQFPFPSEIEITEAEMAARAG